MAAVPTVCLSKIIQAIELCQAVLNKPELASQSVSVSHVADLDKADEQSLAFLAKAKYLPKLAKTCAGVVLVSDKFAKNLPNTRAVIVLVKDAYLAYASVSSLFAYQQDAGIHPTAVISPTATIGKNSTIGAYVVIDDHVKIGDNCQIHAHVVIHHHCQIGDNCQIHAHASIGSEGFGFAPTVAKSELTWQKIHQLGKVIIGDRVRIGAGTCIDRGAVGDTIIADDVIIDNLVQIAHNVHIGRGTAIAAMTGVAGSTQIGAGCMIGGGVGIAGHLHIADGVHLTGRTFVAQSIDKAGSYSSGTTAMPSQDWRRATIKFRQSGQK